MITLKDSIEIKTTPKRIFDWFKNMDKHFTEWHPNHKKFEKVTGGTDEGDIVYFEERVDGKWYRARCKITKIERRERDWRIELKTKGALLSFITEAKEDICIFTHIESFGFKTPIIGSLIDFLILKIFHSRFRLDLVRKDMEDGVPPFLVPPTMRDFLLSPTVV